MNNEEMKSRIESAKRRYEEKLKTRKFSSVQQSYGIPFGEIIVLCAESNVGKSCLYSNTENTV